MAIRASKKKKASCLLALVLLLLLLVLAYKAWRVWGIVQSLQTRLDELQAVTDGSSDLALRDLKDAVTDTHADLQALKSEVGLYLPLTRYLGWVPKFGGDLQAAPALLDVALAVTEAGELTLDSLDPLIDLSEGQGQGDPLIVLAETLAAAHPQLQSAEEKLAWANQRWADVDQAALSERVASLAGRLDAYLPLAETAVQAGQIAPDWLGISKPRAYLVLAQNNDELRATGGFISAVGKLTLVEGGQIGELSFEDSYAVDDFAKPYPDPPPPYPRYMGIDLWVFRDANWWPDWPTSAQAAIDLYQISRELQVDGVVAVDQYALREIVSALAPLSVEGWEEPVTGQNVISLIRLAWTPTEDSAWWQQRKQFVGDLVSAMRAKLEESPDQVDWLALSKALFNAFEQRHVQVWLADAASPAAQLLAEQGWNGAIRPAPNDYLLVVDANLGFNKANALVQQSLDYRVQIHIDQPSQATLLVRHDNSGSGQADCLHQSRYGADYDEIINRCYWNYMRVYVPAGSQLLQATEHPISADWLTGGQAQSGEAETLPPENDKSVFASFFVVPRQQNVQTRFVYQLGEGVVARQAGGDWCYHLLAQKQAGTGAVPLRLTLDLPPGAVVQTVEPAARQVTTEQVVFQTKLEQDREFELCFRLGQD